MANLAESSIWETGVYQIEENDPVHGGANGITNRPIKQLANRTVWLKNELASSVQAINANLASLSTNKADKTLNLVAGNGLTGGGTLQANRTITLGTPSQITASTTNSVTATSHTHAIDKASTTVAGVVQLVDNLTTDDATKALTAKQGKVLHDNKLDKTANAVSASKLATARTINGVAFDGTANITITDNTKAPTVHRHNWSEIDGKPSTFTPSSHTHTIANITDYDVRQISTEDLNGITKWGIYGQSASNQSLAERNYPVPNEAGTLEVMPGTYGLRQRFTTFATHRQFERSRNTAGNGWNDWTELSNTWSAIRNKPSNLAYTSSNVASASRLATARTISLTGAVTGSVSFNGSANVSIATTLNLADFANSKTENGYQKLPNGLIIQWGDKINHEPVVFPIAFPNKVLNVSLTLKVNSRDSDSMESFGVNSVSNTGFSIFNWVSPSQGCYWLAIGY